MLAGLILAAGRGSRLRTSGTWGKHLEPIALGGVKRPLLDFVLERVKPFVGQLAVATGSRSAQVERFLVESHADVFPIKVPAIDNLPLSIEYCLEKLASPSVAIFEGDVIGPARDIARFLKKWNLPTPNRPDLALLIGPKEVLPSRCTVDVSSDGLVLRVRPTRPTDQVRFSILAASIGQDISGRIRELSNGLSSLGVEVRSSIWHRVASTLVLEGRCVSAMVASDGGVNVNTVNDLSLAARYIEQEASEVLASPLSPFQNLAGIDNQQSVLRGGTLAED